MNSTINEAYTTLQSITNEVQRSVVMERQELGVIVGAMAVGGHIFFEGAPGVGKTTLAKALAVATGGSFGRIQGTPDVMPSDITGFAYWDQKEQDYSFRPGPIFNNVVLMDDANRVNTKTQAALLEAMQENQVTVNNETYNIERPFTVLATQNPDEDGEGTNPVPMPARDRFMMGVNVPAQTPKQMVAVYNKLEQSHKTEAVVTPSGLTVVRKAKELVSVDNSLVQSTADAIGDLRDYSEVDQGHSMLNGSRALLSTLDLAKVIAIGRRDGTQNVEPEDIQLAMVYTLPHRTELSFAAQGKHGDNEAAYRSELVSHHARKVA